ncbi:hypothetical protein ACFXG4_50375 [Nocardia sp. NPDC059246]|uniref:hypothetical protein n=1 Tax=unclassified Nocardia TaxID=2637762 RepID=UPI00369BA39B
MWQNVGQAVEKDLSGIRRDLAAALAAQVSAAQSRQAPKVVNQAELKVVTRFREHHSAVYRLLGQGLGKAAMAVSWVCIPPPSARSPTLRRSIR